MTATRLIGPLICTDDGETWARLLTHVFGLCARGQQALSALQIEQLWGVADNEGELRYYETPGTDAGIFTLQLARAATQPTIRDPGSGYDADALKVIDFYTPDFDVAEQRLSDAGFALKGEIADYELPAGRIREGHLWGPDGVVCALIGGAKDFLEGFVSVTDAPFSEVMSVSAPVSDQAAVLEFYRVLGLKELYRYGVDSESFQRLVGSDEPIKISAVNMGSENSAPYVGTIDYALPPGYSRSLAGAAGLPRRGLAGLVLATDDLDHSMAAVRDAGLVIPAEGSGASPGVMVEGRSACVLGPHGVSHWLIES
jgi:catechol 2,3-dioxygenase-like lactoylglutathione lyase family enzyme